MTISSFPWDGQDSFEADWRTMARHWMRPGVIRDIANGCAVTQSAGNVRVQTGEAWIQGHHCVISANEDLSPAAPHLSLPRIDRAVLRADFANNQIVAALVTGTAASTPAAPNVTTSSTVHEILLAQVGVAASSGALTITDERAYARGQGEDPPGIIKPWAGNTVPSGYLAANGQAVSRITYADLFVYLGVNFGAGNGSTTFNVPDLRGRVPVGLDNLLGSADAGRLSVTNTLGGGAGTQNMPMVLGAFTGTTSANHSHLGVTAGAATTAGQNADHVHAYMIPDGAVVDHNLPPYQLVNFLVKV